MPAPRPFTPAEDDYLRRARTANPPVPYSEIGLKLRRRLSNIEQRVSELGLTKKRGKITPEAVQKALAMRRDTTSTDRTWAAIAEALGVKRNSIQKACGTRGAIKPAALPTVKCLCCRVPFRSEDRAKNRICAGCKRTEAFHLPEGW